VFVSGTTEHITLRLSSDLVSDLRNEAQRESRSLSYVVSRRCQIASMQNPLQLVGARNLVQADNLEEFPKLDQPVKLCRSCEGDLRRLKGKLVCMKLGCGMQGIEQGSY